MELNPFAFPPTLSSPSIDTIRWLGRLRWVAVVGQLLTVSAAYVLGFQLTYIPLLIFIAATAITNSFFVAWIFWLSQFDEPLPNQTGSDASVSRAAYLASRVVFAILVLDLLSLTGLLYWSGGTANPFLFFYFVNIAIAGLILRPFWAWVLTILAVLCVLVLLSSSNHVPGITDLTRVQQPRWGVLDYGYAIAFATSGFVVTYFVIKLMDELRVREQRLAEVEQQRARSQRLEAMATLAAGAGHELASPLSTIAVVSKELSRNLEKIEVPNSIRADVALIRSELDRCREILARMKSGAGEAAAEKLDPISLEALFQEVMLGLRDSSRIDLQASQESREFQVTIPVQAVALSFRNIIQNALDASAHDKRVQVEYQSTDSGWAVVVTDQGTGMENSVRDRIGEPFFTTKEPGRGMGMGIFLARNVVARLAGTIHYESRPGKGTVCRVTIPTPKASEKRRR